MLVQTQVGPIAQGQSITPGLLVPVRSGQLGDTVVSALHGRYYETTYRKAMFSANVSAVSTTAALANTYTGLALANPTGSTVNLVVNKVTAALGAAATAIAGLGTMYGVLNGAPFSSTTVPVRNNFFGTGPSGQGIAYSAYGGNLVSGANFILVDIIGALGTLATASQNQFPFTLDLEGNTILPPGTVIALYTSAAQTGTQLYASITWEEVPV